MYVFIHNDGELLQSYLRNDLEELFASEHYNMHVQVSVVKLSSSRALKCSQNGLNFDSCVFKNTLKQFGTKCIPFFMTINELGGNFSVCKNFQESQEALKIFQSSGRSCENPCTQVEMGTFCLFIGREGPFSFVFYH